MLQATKKLQRTFLCMALVAILVSVAVKNVDASFKSAADFDTHVSTLFQKIKFNGKPPPYDLFYHAFAGYSKLKKRNLLSAKEILTVIDFRISGNEKRLWVIDLKNGTLLFHVLTAHGRNSGDVFAKTFSNTINSNQSSLGFYVTGNKYIGKHGISLKLRGVEKGINDNAETRAIVMHAADYVSESHIKKYGRLGRSFGCPAVPVEVHKEIIDTLSQGTCLFIYYPDTDYLTRTAIKGTPDL